MKVFTVVGNRPQFIKAAPLSSALREAAIEEVVLHTGQHWYHTLSQVFFDQLGVPEPRYRLDLQTSEVERMQPAVAERIAAEEPDIVLVYGDTNSTLAGARAAADASIPLAHVEAGLRSGDLSMPEEHNRIETDRLAWLLFCPDDRSRRTLTDEGVMGRIYVVGDVMADATRIFAPIARAAFPVPHEPRSYVVATIHRQANVEQPRLGAIVDGLDRIGEMVVFPVHPRTRVRIEQEGLSPGSHVRVIEPLSYLELASLASQARVIVTDSGGLQKEAYWYGVPCVTVRPSTEWVDTVAEGANVLVEAAPEAIAEAVANAAMPPSRPVLYGDGHASERITQVLVATIPSR
ncbi:MAG TPA: UDP-N-acetylglucosamine 2-epimerase (non-hydrolyzing) [Gaiellaceae bacterium]|nr:UDP-N-acetylglucosamine 2-epimerase (non-hydrolyzing) [Gaiellaceae bacterium]